MKHDLTIRIPSSWSERQAEDLYLRLVGQTLPEDVYVELKQQDGRDVKTLMVRTPENFR